MEWLWNNIRPLRDADQEVGRALVEFGRMIEDGRAFGPIGHSFQGIVPRYRIGDFPANDPLQAAESMRRAASQHVKGRLSDAELAKIVHRCSAVIKRGY